MIQCIYIDASCANALVKRTSHVWHPNTQMREWDGFDEVVRGDGMHLVCSDGTRLLDGVASMWCNVWGHSRRELVRAISRQAATLAHSPLFNITHAPAERLADELVKIAPGMHRVFYSDNGSTAMEVAAKMAIQYWSNSGDKRRKRIVSLKNGYHGDTFGAMSIGYAPQFFARFREYAFGVDQIPAPRAPGIGRMRDSEADIDVCLDEAERRLARGDVAALVMESGAQVAGGVRIFPPRYQSGISKICRESGTLLVLDEVATGFGRLGSMTEYVAQRSRPDIVAFGKMITGGYATLGATLASRRVSDAFLGAHADLRHLFHGHTYSGNPIASAVALENIRMYSRYRLLERVRTTSRILGGFAHEFASKALVSEVRHKGMLMGIELGNDPGSTSRGIARSPNRVVYEAGKRNGVYLRTLGRTIMIVPPLYMNPTDIRMLCRAVLGTIDSLQG